MAKKKSAPTERNLSIVPIEKELSREEKRKLKFDEIKNNYAKEGLDVKTSYFRTPNTGSVFVTVTDTNSNYPLFSTVLEPIGDKEAPTSYKLSEIRKPFSFDNDNFLADKDLVSRAMNQAAQDLELPIVKGGGSRVPKRKDLGYINEIINEVDLPEVNIENMGQRIASKAASSPETRNIAGDVLDASSRFGKKALKSIAPIVPLAGTGLAAYSAFENEDAMAAVPFLDSSESVGQSPADERLMLKEDQARKNYYNSPARQDFINNQNAQSMPLYRGPASLPEQSGQMASGGLTQEEEIELQELERELEGGNIQNTRNVATTKLSPQEEMELLQLEEELGQESFNDEPGFFSELGSSLMGGLQTVGQAVDSYTGAPLRSAISAGFSGQNPISAFANQFGEDTALAPTGKETAMTMGFSDQSQMVARNPYAIQDEARAFRRPIESVPKQVETFSPAEMAGVAIDVGADLSNFIPVGAALKVAKGGKNLAKSGTKFVLKNSVAGIEAAADTKAISNTYKTTSDYIDRVVKSVKGQFNPSVAPDFEDFKTIAKNNGIDPEILPETVEFGKESVIARKSQQVSEGPGGQLAQSRYLKAQGAVEEALENNLSTISGGKVMSPAEVGDFLGESYNKAVKQFFEQDFLTHGKIINENPGLILNQDAVKSVQSKIKGLKNKATGRARRGFGSQREEASSFLQDVDILERSLDKFGNLSYKRANELLTNIGEEAFKKYPVGTKIPTDQKALQDIYFTLREAMVDTVSHSLGNEKALELANSNQIISDFLKENGKVSKIFKGDLSKEVIFNKVSKFNLDEIEALKSILSPEDFQKFKGSYLDSLIVRNGEGSPLYRSTMRRIAPKADHLKAILSPDEAKNFGDLLRLGDRVGEWVFNTSKTETAGRFSASRMIEEIASGGVDELTLEKLKEIARKKANKPVETTFKKGPEKLTPNQAKKVIRQIPLLESKTRQALATGKVSAIQERNEEAKRRRIAISGSK